MVVPYNRKLKQRSRELRMDMTVAEKKLWACVRRKQLKGYLFYRQKPVGNYIVDFYCPSAKLIIEVDGEYHLDREQKEYDPYRDGYLKGLGFCVMRVTNEEVLGDVEKVVERILGNLG